MKKQWMIKLWAVVLVLVLPSLARAEGDFIVVGCPMPAKASYGINGIRGLTLASEEINAAGGVTINGKKHLLKLEFVDTGDLTPKTTQDEVMAKVENLITEKKVDVLVGGPNRSEYGVAAMDVVAKHDIVHIASSGCYTPKWNEVKFASDPKKYRKSFRMSGNIKWYISETKDLLNSMKKKYGFKKMFIMTQDALMCRDAAQIVRKVMEKEGWEIVGQEVNSSETTDFSENLKKCKASGANVLFLWNYSPNTSFLFEQWRNMEIPAIPVGYVEVAEDPGFWDKTRGKCGYSVITLSESGTTLSDVTPWSPRYFNAYKKRWGVDPRSTSSVACYEALYVLKDAVERANSLKPDALIPALEKTDLPVVRGRLRFDVNHQCVFGYDPKTTILGNWAQWQEGERVTIWPEAGMTGELKMPPWMQWYLLKAKNK
jgi:branched-chain amino acid transport system substrate-binding protein